MFQHKTFSDVNHFQLKIFFEKTIDFPVFGCYPEKYFLHRLHFFLCVCVCVCGGGVELAEKGAMSAIDQSMGEEGGFEERSWGWIIFYDLKKRS